MTSSRTSSGTVHNAKSSSHGHGTPFNGTQLIRKRSALRGGAPPWPAGRVPPVQDAVPSGSRTLCYTRVGLGNGDGLCLKDAPGGQDGREVYWPPSLTNPVEVPLYLWMTFP